MNLNTLSEAAHANAVDKGFWEDKDQVPRGHLFTRRIALIHSELSEGAFYVLVGLNSAPDHLREFIEELADVCIRIFDLNGFLGLDLDAKRQAIAPGTWDALEYTHAQALLDLHQQISHTLEADRKNLGAHVMATAFANAIWLAENIAGELGYNIYAMIDWKMTKNRGREYKHGAQY